MFEAIRTDDGDWRSLVFRRYERMVRNLISRRLGSTDELDDLVSEVFLRFFQQATRVRNASGLPNYLYAIALHTTRNKIHLRRRERRAFSSSAPDVADQTSSPDDPRARAALRHLETILRGMGTSEREAYVLRQVAGLGLAQVASALGVSLSTARRRVRSARRFVEKRSARSALLSDYVCTLAPRAVPAAACGRLNDHERSIELPPHRASRT